MKLAPVLEELSRQLTELHLKFALVGGLGASARGEPRFTRDVDVAVRVDDDHAAKAVLHQLNRRGYSVVTTVEQDAVGRLATARLLHPSGILCDVLFASCGIEAEVVTDAVLLEVFEDVKVPTATTEALLAMKVLSATAQRPRDLEDLRALMAAAPPYDEARVLELLALVTARGFARGQDLPAKWAELKARFDPATATF